MSQTTLSPQVHRPTIPYPSPFWPRMAPADMLGREVHFPAIGIPDTPCSQPPCEVTYKEWSDAWRPVNDTFNQNPVCQALSGDLFCAFDIDPYHVLCWKDMKRCEWNERNGNGRNDFSMKCDGQQFRDCDLHGTKHLIVDCDEKKNTCKLTSGGSALVKGILQNPAYWLTIVVLAVSVF